MIQLMKMKCRSLFLMEFTGFEKKFLFSKFFTLKKNWKLKVFFELAFQHVGLPKNLAHMHAESVPL